MIKHCSFCLLRQSYNEPLMRFHAIFIGNTSTLAPRNPEDRPGPLVTCTGNTGRSPVLTGELVPVNWHGLPVQMTNVPDRSSETLWRLLGILNDKTLLFFLLRHFLTK